MVPENTDRSDLPTPLKIDDLIKEVEVTTMRSSGPGGQHVNKTESAVRIKHLPTGITVIARDSRSQLRNRELAWQRLIEKLEARRRKKKKRIPTQVPATVHEKRLAEKTRRGQKKVERARPREEKG